MSSNFTRAFEYQSVVISPSFFIFVVAGKFFWHAQNSFKL